MPFRFRYGMDCLPVFPLEKPYHNVRKIKSAFLPSPLPNIPVNVFPAAPVSIRSHLKPDALKHCLKCTGCLPQVPLYQKSPFLFLPTASQSFTILSVFASINWPHCSLLIITFSFLDLLLIKFQPCGRGYAKRGARFFRIRQA